MIVFGSVLTTFELSSIFGGSWGSTGNWLNPKTESPSAKSVKCSVGMEIDDVTWHAQLADRWGQSCKPLEHFFRDTFPFPTWYQIHQSFITWGRFHQHFTLSFYIRRSKKAKDFTVFFALLGSASKKKLPVKCWWNWPLF